MSSSAIHGSRPVHLPGAEPGNPADPDRTIQVTIVLRPPDIPRNTPLSARVRAHDGGWPGCRPVLSRSDIAAIYRPHDDVVRAILGLARRQGLHVVEVSRPRHDVLLSGTIAQFDKACALRQREYQHELGSYRAHQEPIRLPSRVADLVQGVLGLDTIPHARPALAPGTGRLIPPRSLARHYRFPPMPAGRAPRIAVLEFGGGIHATDLHALRRAGARIRMSAITDGDGATPANAPLEPSALRKILRDWRAGLSFAQLSQRHGNQVLDFMATLETTMDAELVCALAPGAPVELMFASPGADGWRRALYAQLGFPYPDSVSGPRRSPDDLPAAISVSWGMSEASWGRMKLRVLHGTLEAAMRRDVTVCCSTGDFGSRNSPGGPHGFAVNYPASSTWSLACGGTHLRPHRTGPRRETAWREPVRGSLLAGGGGMSGYFPRPPHQDPIAVRPAKHTWRAGKPLTFCGRWVPDVAAHAAFDPGIAIRLLGRRVAGGGTSAATPTWAALCARLGAALGAPLGWAGPALYALADTGAFHDIRHGNNDLRPGHRRGAWYRAEAGWDPTSGLGSPDGMALLRGLLAGGP